MEEVEFPIYVEGLTHLNDEEKRLVDKILQKHVTRFKRLLTGVNFLKVHIRAPKEDQPGRVHFEVSVQLSMPGRAFETSALGWRVSEVLEKALKKLGEQVKRFKSRRKEISRREREMIELEYV